MSNFAQVLFPRIKNYFYNEYAKLENKVYWPYIKQKLGDMKMASDNEYITWLLDEEYNRTI